MKHSIFYLIFALLLSCNTKPSNDDFSLFNKSALAKELDSIYKLDQKLRKEIMAAQQKLGTQAPEVKKLWNRQHTIDSSNLRRIMEIIEHVDSYPGKSIVGDTVSSAAFYVLQHSPDSIQTKYHDLIINAAEEGELDKNLAAMYQDRYLMHKEQPQIYGTQIRMDQKTNPKTGEKKDSTYVWPIADTTNIDSLRKANGLNPLEDYLNQFGISRWK